MKTTFVKLAVCASCAWATGFLVNAGPLQRAEVPASVAWMLHLDCDALRPTAIGQYVLAAMDKPEAKAKLAAFQTIFNFDLRTQLHGATLYGPGPTPEDAVLIVYADFDPARLLTLAQAAKDYQSSLHNQTVIHNWIDEKRPANPVVKPRTYAAIQGNRIIFGQREDRVAQALDVIAGSAPSLASSNSFSEFGAPGDSHFLEAAANKMNLPDAAPNAAMLKLTQTVQLSLSEVQQQFQAKVVLVADSAEVAGHILSVAQGLVALAKLQTDKPESVKLANAITLTQDAARVIGTFTLPDGDVVEIMKADAARKAAAAAAPAANAP